MTIINKKKLVSSFAALRTPGNIPRTIIINCYNENYPTILVYEINCFLLYLIIVWANKIFTFPLNSTNHDSIFLLYIRMLFTYHVSNNFMMIHKYFHRFLNVVVIESNPHDPASDWWHIPWQFRMLPLLVVTIYTFKNNTLIWHESTNQSHISNS